MAILALTDLLAVVILSNPEGGFSDFNELGNLLLGGFVLAVGVAVAITFIRLRMRDKKPPAAQFISISSLDKKD